MNAKSFYILSLFLLNLPIFAFSNTAPAPQPPAGAAEEVSKEVHKAAEAVQHAVPGMAEPSAMKIILTLVGLIAFLLISAFALRKLMGGKTGFFGGSKGIQILERRAISPKSALYLVEVEGKKVLIAESQLEVRRIAILDDANNEKLNG